jgi:hypothetical protein
MSPSTLDILRSANMRLEVRGDQADPKTRAVVGSLARHIELPVRAEIPHLADQL